jgi:hypothetical protein
MKNMSGNRRQKNFPRKRKRPPRFIGKAAKLVIRFSLWHKRRKGKS